MSNHHNSYPDNRAGQPIEGVNELREVMRSLLKDLRSATSDTPGQFEKIATARLRTLKLAANIKGRFTAGCAMGVEVIIFRGEFNNKSISIQVQ